MVEKWACMMKCKFGSQKCFCSIWKIHDDLVGMDMIFEILVGRWFDWYMICWIRHFCTVAPPPGWSGKTTGATTPASGYFRVWSYVFASCVPCGAGMCVWLAMNCLTVPCMHVDCWVCVPPCLMKRWVLLFEWGPFDCFARLIVWWMYFLSFNSNICFPSISFIIQLFCSS